MSREEAQPGKKLLGDVFPSLAGTDYTIEDELDSKIDIAFSAMSHKSSVDIVPALLGQGIRVVDASADFRLQNAGEHSKWYGFTIRRPSR